VLAGRGGQVAIETRTGLVGISGFGVINAELSRHL
jgi:hypothetical protein